MKTLLLFNLALDSVLCSCGIGSYSNPKGDPATLATIKCTQVGNAIYPREMYTVDAIDLVDVYYGRSWSNTTKNIVLKPGRHVLMASVYRRMGMSPYRGLTNVVFVAQPGKKYVLTGRNSGAISSVWVEDMETHQKVSNVALARMQFVPPSAPVYIMVPQ